MARTKRLGVWLDGQHIADLEQRRWREIRCRYTEAALEQWPLNSPLISCSLPLSEDPQDALHFCKGLLAEGKALQALAQQAGVAANETFGLLARYGRDIAGALIISEDEPQPQRFAVETYDPEGLERAIDDLDDHPLGVDDESELSLAGLQDKLLLVKLPRGRWGRPLRGRPSTHILKRDDLRRQGLVEAEAHCLELARRVGLTTIEAQLETIGPHACLIASRFDRRGSGNKVTRIHQEDVCQATNTDPESNRGRGKYESGGGPSLRQVADLLDTYASDPEAELDRLVAVTTFTVAIGNADAHAKNLALIHRTPGTVELAPLYDTVPTVLWPKLRTSAAMSIGGIEELSDVTSDDLVREAKSWAHPAERARTVISQTLTDLEQAIDDDAIPSRSKLAKFVRSRCQQLSTN